MLVCLLSWLPSYRVALGWLCPLTKGHHSAFGWPQNLWIFSFWVLILPTLCCFQLWSKSLSVPLWTYHTLRNRLSLVFNIVSKSNIASYVWSKTKMLSIQSHEAIFLGSHFKNTISAHTFKPALGKLIVVYCLSKGRKVSLIWMTTYYSNVLSWKDSFRFWMAFVLAAIEFVLC